ncbi:hypothetical protein HPB51_013814 [Rhipicephalus microplus]|uniref:Uncharacterized protein n=1 Tax=Rhipicephalus microplus TaxID=6941 RepID=A0A9J6F2Z2_RHIMP|nr:hypothetical protein HPB51_013814 [Rhipicephalus microplus]
MAAYYVRYQMQPSYSVDSICCWDQPVPQVAVEERDATFVPNIVHFVRLGNVPLSFIEVVSIRAAWLQQKPDYLMVHCNNCTATTESENWKHIKDIPRLTLRYVEKPETIFGINISFIEHASDIVRIRVLRKYGGIYLDRRLLRRQKFRQGVSCMMSASPVDYTATLYQKDLERCEEETRIR